MFGIPPPPLPQEQLSVSNSLTSMGDIADPPSSPLGATDSTDDSDEDEDEDSEMDDWELHQPQSFNPHNLCKLSVVNKSPMLWLCFLIQVAKMPF